MKLNHINCESTDSESDTDNAQDYEPIIYEQPIHSYIFTNHDHFLLNYFTRPTSSNETIEKIIEEITEEKPTECSSTNNNYQNMPKETQLPKEKIWTIPLL